MFDPICFAKINALMSGGGAGSVTTNNITADTRKIDNSDVTVMGVGFSHISPLTPSKEELAGGQMQLTMRNENTGKAESLVMSVGNVMFDDEMAYGGTLCIDDINTSHMFAIAYKAGYWAAADATIDKPGFYIHFTLGDPGEGITAEVVCEWETIHPIDPKFLPGVCLPVVEIATQPTDEGAPLTAEESAKMDEVAAMGLPIVCRVKIDDEASITAVLLMMKSETGTAYSCVLEGASQLSIVNINGSWAIAMVGG